MPTLLAAALPDHPDTAHAPAVRRGRQAGHLAAVDHAHVAEGTHPAADPALQQRPAHHQAREAGRGLAQQEAVVVPAEVALDVGDERARGDQLVGQATEQLLERGPPAGQQPVGVAVLGDAFAVPVGGRELPSSQANRRPIPAETAAPIGLLRGSGDQSEAGMSGDPQLGGRQPLAAPAFQLQA
jgi:hypothetical protein